MRPTLLRAAPLALALLIAPQLATAATHVVVADLKGDKKGAAAKPLRAAICAQLSCVSNASVGLPKKLDWKKAAKANVGAVITGSVTKSKVKLELQTHAGAPAKTWSFTLVKGKLKPVDITAVRADVVDLVSPPPPPAPAPEPVAAPPAPAPAPVPVVAPAPPPKSTFKPEVAPPPKPVEVAAKPEEKHVSHDDSGPSLAHVMLGLDISRRTLRYSGLTSGNLSEYVAPAIYAPRLQADIFPLAGSDSPARGLGVDLDYRLAVGLKSAVTGGETHPTRASVFALDAKYRIDPTGDGKYGIIPFVGYRRAGFRVDPASDGSNFVGLPKIVTGGIRVGLGADLSPVEKLHVLAQLDYEIILAKADLIGPDYFPSGSASAFEGELGAGYEVASHIDVRVAFEFEHTGFGFDSGSGVYRATGASETLLGGRLMAGYSF